MEKMIYSFRAAQKTNWELPEKDMENTEEIVIILPPAPPFLHQPVKYLSKPNSNFADSS